MTEVLKKWQNFNFFYKNVYCLIISLISKLSFARSENIWIHLNFNISQNLTLRLIFISLRDTCCDRLIFSLKNFISSFNFFLIWEEALEIVSVSVQMNFKTFEIENFSSTDEALKLTKKKINAKINITLTFTAFILMIVISVNKAQKNWKFKILIHFIIALIRSSFLLQVACFRVCI